MRTGWVLFLAFLASLGPAQQLTIGDRAPSLSDVRWLRGSYSLPAQQTYVVEFWASWCLPCRHAFAHLDNLAKSHPEVPFLAISSYEDDLAAADAYARTLPKCLSIGFDDQSRGRIGKAATDWMVASDEVHVPTTFLVQQGRIAWIGQPEELDVPLISVLEGHWNIATAKNSRRQSAKARAKQDGTLAILAKINRALKDQRKAEALKLCDEIEKLPPDPKNPDMPSAAILMRCMVAYKSRDTELFYKVLAEQADLLKDPDSLNGIAWFIVDPETSLKWRDKPLGLRLARKSVDLANRSKYNAIDTLAWALYQIGDYEGAVKTEEEAVSKCTSPKTKADLDLTLALFKKKLDTPH